MTNIVVCGAAGKMGRKICACVKEKDACRLIAGIDRDTEPYSDFPLFTSPEQLPSKPDVLIDFSHPSALDALLSYCVSMNVPIVIGSTGYSDEQITSIKTASEKIPVFFTFNMSLGINLLVQLVRKAASVLGEGFDVEIIEKHHNQKIDAPSGTALMLAEEINKAKGNTMHYIYDRHNVRAKREVSEIGIHSLRGGTIVGEHEVIFAGKDEVITLSHSAASKMVFAEGALNAALFIASKSPGLYDMQMLVGL